jgi:hypothetical protein
VGIVCESRKNTLPYHFGSRVRYSSPHGMLHGPTI